MFIEHIFNGKRVKGEGTEGFLLTNNKGCFISSGIKSKYRGFFQFLNDKETPLKSVHEITISSSPKKIINRLSYVERIHKDAVERFRILRNSFIYEVENYAGPAKITLDVRRMYDNPAFGRIHKIYKHGKFVVIEYCKYTDGSLQELEEKFFIVVEGLGSYAVIDRWVKTHNSYDELRNDNPEQYIYEALQANINKNARIIFSVSKKLKDAVAEAGYVKKNFVKLASLKETGLRKRLHYNDIILNLVLNAMDSLVVDADDLECRILAGLPWFFHEWRRDELISVGYLIREGDYVKAKKILMRHFKDFRIGSALSSLYPNSDLLSADAAGLACFRMNQLITVLKDKALLNKYFSIDELRDIFKNLSKEITNIGEERIKNSLVYSLAKETWMDTSEYGNSREGACIEIQALTMNMYELSDTIASIIGKSFRCTSRKQELLKNTRIQMINKGIAIDRIIRAGDPDLTVRPNVFLAYYLYPKLFSREVWERTFDNALKRLWLSWGGLASVAKDDARFTGMDDGILNKAYHWGDSWYFINNISAISMLSLNRKKYWKYISKIINASLTDLLFKGYAGMCSEISSANVQEAKGCWSQAWSSATLLEMLKIVTEMKTHP